MRSPRSLAPMKGKAIPAKLLPPPVQPITTSIEANAWRPATLGAQLTTPAGTDVKTGGLTPCFTVSQKEW